MEVARQAEEAKKIKERIKALADAEVWPNGNPAGMMFLAVMLVLLIATVSPALVVFALLALLVSGIGKTVLRIWKSAVT